MYLHLKFFLGGSTAAVIAKSKQTDGEDETQVISTAKKSIRVER